MTMKTLFIFLLVSSMIITQVGGNQQQQEFNRLDKSQKSSTSIRRRTTEGTSGEKNPKQNIYFVIKPYDDSTDSPTPAPSDNPEIRSYAFRSCDRPSQNTMGNQGQMNDNIATINFKYDVKTKTQGGNGLTADDKEIIVDTLSQKILDSLHNTHCNRRLIGDGTTIDRQLLVDTISTGLTDSSSTEACERQANNDNNPNKSCTRFDGTIIVGYTDMGMPATEEEVASSILGQIEMDMDNGMYLDGLNTELEKESSDATVTEVSFVPIPEPEVSSNELDDESTSASISAVEKSEFSTSTEKGFVLNNLGIAMVAVVGLAFIALLGVCCCWYVTQKKIKSWEENEANKNKNNNNKDQQSKADTAEDEEGIELDFNSDEDVIRDVIRTGITKKGIDKKSAEEGTMEKLEFRDGRLSPIREVSTPVNGEGGNKPNGPFSQRALMDDTYDDESQQQQQEKKANKCCCGGMDEFCCNPGCAMTGENNCCALPGENDCTYGGNCWPTSNDDPTYEEPPKNEPPKQEQQKKGKDGSVIVVDMGSFDAGNNGLETLEQVSL